MPTTVTIRATAAFLNPFTDLRRPSALDIVVTNSNDPNIPNGLYDAWCLDPFAPFYVRTNYSAAGYGSQDDAGYQAVNLGALTATQIAQINWLVAQNFAWDPKFGGQYSFGEVQAAIWELVGYTNYFGAFNGGIQAWLTNNGKVPYQQDDVLKLKTLAVDAIASGNAELPANAFFSVLLDPAGNVQPFLIQLATSKLGDYVWEDLDGDGVQDANESGVNGVLVRLFDDAGNLLAETVTGDDLSTTEVEQGFYQFTGLAAGKYQVQFVKPAEFAAFTQANALGPGVPGDALDSDADAQGFTQVIHLGNDEINGTLDAGLVRGAQIGDRVWVDADGNGRQDAGEAGLAGVTVNLKNAAGAVIATTVTDANGNYLFNNLSPGTYSVQFVPPAGYVFTTRDAAGASDADDSDADVVTGETAQTALSAGESDLSWDAGLVQKARIGDTIFLDKDADGVQDAGEGGIGNVTVQLKNATGAVVATTTTDANGKYFFDVNPGTYSIQVTAPAGYVISPKNQGGNDALDSDLNANGSSDTVTVSSGETNNTLDGGLYQKASLGDRVWLDANGNGRQDAGEAGVGHVTVRLLNAAGSVVATTTTDANGNYLFNNLTPGTYSVQFVAPSGYIFTTKDAAGSTDTNDSDADITTGNTIQTVLESGENDLSWDAGLVQKARIGDTIFLDKDADGVQDAGEGGIANVTVQLKNAAGAVVATTTTDADGKYFFDVDPGTYSIQVTAPAGYVISPKNQGGNDALDSDLNADGSSDTVTVASGQTNNTLDGGLYQKASLGDRVWLDANGNGRQDAGEAGVANVSVQLRNGSGVVVATTTTDANGNYLFDNLTPGTYSVKFVRPEGYIFTTRDADGTTDENDSDAFRRGGTIRTVLESGENDLSWDAGLKVQKARIGDTIFLDKDADGVQDAGEAGIANVSIQLKNAAGAVVATTTTDANGKYFFVVDPGTYSIQVTAPAGYVISPKNQGGDDALDSDLNANGSSDTVTVSAGETNNTLDGGLYQRASLGDRVWLDANGNGRQDAGEAGVGHVTVRLLNAAGSVVATTTTDANGNYLFNNLTPGTYSVQFVAPSGYIFTTKDAAGSNDTNDSDADITTGRTIQTVLESGENDLSWDAGLVQRSRIGDTIFLDKDADGVQDAGEAGIANVSVQLKNAAGAVVATTTTDANGKYFFDVDPGTYSIQVTAPAGYVISPKNQGGNDALDSDLNANGSSDTVTVSAGETNNTLDGGLYQKASLGDRVWLDANGNGRQDAGEAGVGHVTVRLLNAAGSVVATTTTDANGNYLFNNLTPGTYSVQFVAPSGYIFTTKDAAGSTDTNDSDADVTTGRTIQTVLHSGENDLSWDAGLVEQKPGIQIVKDANVNEVGVNQPVIFTYTVSNTGTVALANVTVKDDNATADFAGDDFVPTAVLGAGGRNIGDLDADGLLDVGELWKYQATVIPAVQMSATIDGKEYDSGTLSYQFLNNGDVRVFYRQSTDITDNTYGTGADASWAKGHKFKDLVGSDKAGFVVKYSDGSTLAKFYMDYISETGNTDGYQHWSGYGSAGIGGKEGKLLEGNGNWLKDFDSTLELNLNRQGYTGMTTNSPQGDANWDPVNGYYFTIDKAAFGSKGFGGVSIFDQHNSPPKVGKNSIVPTIEYGPSTNTATVTATGGGTTVTDTDKETVQVVAPKASVGDRVWHDKNYNGVQDTSETGVSGVKVFLQNANGATIATTVTDANGNYRFADLDAGTYRLAFDKSAAKWEGKNISHYRWTNKDRGGNDALDSDVAGGSQTVSHTDFFHLAAGTHDSTRDAGLFTPIVIDLNGDGVRTISRGAAGGVFDLFGSGTAISSGWVSAEDGMLAVDLNGNGVIDSGAELFGGFAKGAGFARLAAFDTNADGVVDASDADFGSLRIWRDANSNHQTDAGELMTLADAGLVSLDVTYVELPSVDANGNLHLERSSATMADGRGVDMTDVYFNVDAADATAAGVQLLSFEELLGEDASVDLLLGGVLQSPLAAPVGSASEVAVINCDFDAARMVIDQLERHEQLISA